MRVNRENIVYIAAFAIFAVFFGVLYFTGEPIYVGDTYQYEHQMIMREPVYSLLIQFVRFLSPEHHFQIIIALQNLLAVAANTAVIVFMRRRCGLNVPSTLLFTVILLMPHIMTPVLSRTHLLLTNALMTEGISYSIYPLAFVSLLDMMWGGAPVGRKSFRTLLIFLLMTLIRGQMMVLFVVWFLVAYILTVKNAVRVTEKTQGRMDTFRFTENISKQGLIAIIAAFIIAFAARSVVIHVYNYLEQGLFVDTISGKAMSFANVLYVADREDGEVIADEALRELFYEMYDAADVNDMNYTDAPSGILARAKYHEDCHDELNFTYFGETAKSYVTRTQGIDTDRFQELMIEVDEIAAELTGLLMPQVIGRYAVNYLYVIALGFIRSVAVEHAVLAWYTLFIYAAAVVLTAVLWIKNPRSKAAPFMAVVLVTIVGNVCATALMIQCISRYMIYNFPLFYMAGFLELKELVKIDRERHG